MNNTRKSFNNFFLNYNSQSLFTDTQVVSKEIGKNIENLDNNNQKLNR